MSIESAIRTEALALAQKAFDSNAIPGINLRHAEMIAQPPRVGSRAAEELSILADVLDHLEQRHGDASTVDWITRCRLLAAETATERQFAQRRHVEQILAISESDDVAFRAMSWAEKAVALATDYGLQDLHDAAVVRMQKLSRMDMGWSRHTAEINIPISVFRQRERLVARFSSWEQALSVFLARDSPSGNDQDNRRAATGFRKGILDLVSGRTFGSHQLPERTHGTADIENLAKVVQSNIGSSAITLRLDLGAIASRFGIPDEESIVLHLSTAYSSSPEIVRLFAQALRLYWDGDSSSAARLAIPLIEAGARELLFLMDQPLYRMERGSSPGRFPAMDFYLDKLEEVGLDPDWATALRATLLNGGMNLRNRLAHGFQLDFSAEEAALVIRLAGLFIAMPVGVDAITDERIRAPLALSRTRLRRRLGWVWR